MKRYMCDAAEEVTLWEIPQGDGKGNIFLFPFFLHLPNTAGHQLGQALWITEQTLQRVSSYIPILRLPVKTEASQRATAITEISIPYRTGLGFLVGVSASMRDKLVWFLIIKMEAAGCKGEEILGLPWLIHVIPSSIKGDAMGNPTLLISSHFPLESWMGTSGEQFKLLLLPHLRSHCKNQGSNPGRLVSFQHSYCRFLPLCPGEELCSIQSSNLHCRRHGLQSLFLLFKSSVPCDKVPHSQAVKNTASLF